MICALMLIGTVYLNPCDVIFMKKGMWSNKLGNPEYCELYFQKRKALLVWKPCLEIIQTMKEGLKYEN